LSEVRWRTAEEFPSTDERGGYESWNVPVPAGVSVTCATLAPMSHTAAQLQALVERCEQFRDAKASKGYRDGLALCVIDSVQSADVTYSSVANVVARYRAYSRSEGGDPNHDGVGDLLATSDELNGPDGWSQKIGNGNRTSRRDGVLKAEAIRDPAPWCSPPRGLRRPPPFAKRLRTRRAWRGAWHRD
jgi:hypothetical protein